MNKVDIFIEFIKSEFAKNNSVSFWVCVLLFSIASSFLTWLYLSKVSYKMKLNKVSELNHDNKKLTKNNEQLKNKIQDLENKNEELQQTNADLNYKLKSVQYAFDTYDCDDNQVSEDPALKKFLIN